LGNRHRLLPFIICLLSTLAFVTSFVSAVRGAQIHEVERLSTITGVLDTWLGSNILTDIIIVSSLCYFLSRSRTGFKSTDQIIDKLLYLVVNTGLAPTIMELSHLISFSISPMVFAHFTFNFLAPKLYANSLMASLNARVFMLKDISDTSTSLDFSGTNRLEADYHSDSHNSSTPEIRGKSFGQLAALGRGEV